MYNYRKLTNSLSFLYLLSRNDDYPPPTEGVRMTKLTVTVFVTFIASLSMAEASELPGTLSMTCNRYSAEGCSVPKATFDMCSYRKVKSKGDEFIQYDLRASVTNAAMTFRIPAKLPPEDQGSVMTAVAVEVPGIPQRISLFCMAPHANEYLPNHYWNCYGQDRMNDWGDTLEFDMVDSYCSAGAAIEETTKP